jgi:hypothetical protein
LFITTPDFLPQHRAQHQQTLQIISAAQVSFPSYRGDIA